MLRVLITIDTEFWPAEAGGPESVRSAIDRDLWGITPQGEYGVRHQARFLGEHGLKAVFFLEALSAGATGGGPHREVVGAAAAHGHETQLHVHPEWLARGATVLPPRAALHMREFDLAEQAAMIRAGRQALEACGAKRVSAFRAGNYGANWETLKALAQVGISYDSSYNHCYQGATTDMPGPLVLQPKQVHGVWELPVTFFRDRPLHFRHFQVTACSFYEMRHVLDQAHALGWSHVVLVSHSFELVDRRRRRPDRAVIRRFERLCRYLADNRDRFETVGFEDLDAAVLARGGPPAPLRSTVLLTAERMAQQAIRRIGY